MANDTRVPHNPDAERMVLGSILLDAANQFPGVRDSLDAGDFYAEKHRRIYTAMCDMWDGGQCIDRLTVINTLQERGWLQSCEGISGIASLDEGMPAVVNLGDWVRIVRRDAVLRQAQATCLKVAQQIENHEYDAPELIQQAERALAGFGERLADDAGFQTPLQVIEHCGGINEYLDRTRLKGVMTPWPSLNRMTTGFHAGEMIVLAALTGRGKTAFALNAAIHAAQQGTGVALFSLEMSSRELTDRIMSRLGGFDSQFIRRGAFSRTAPVPVSEELKYSIQRAYSEAHELRLYIRDKGNTTVPGVHATVRKLMARAPIGLVIVDYLQLMRGVGRFDSRANEVSSISHELKRAAMDLGVPFLVLSQFNRESARGNEPPQLSHLKDSGSIEQDANVVLFLHGDANFRERPAEDCPLTLILEKQRNGPTGRIAMWFRPDCGRFTEMETEHAACA
jgi:replicative DNA helicase